MITQSWCCNNLYEYKGLDGQKVVVARDKALGFSLLVNPTLENDVCILGDSISINPTSSSDGRVVRASASGAVDLGLVPSRVKPMTVKLVFTTA